MPSSKQHHPTPPVVGTPSDPYPIPTDANTSPCAAALAAAIFEGLTLPSYMATVIPGPHALFLTFGMDAAEEFITSHFDLDDEQADIIMQACHIAADVALRAAGVELSYTTAYHRATAHLR
jgi:hypothetical protein